MVVYIIMGVCGSGKATIATALAEKLGCPYRDADDFHSIENKAKMASGIPLTDEDRLPWLQAIHTYIIELLESKSTGVVTCSALKTVYRKILLEGDIDSRETSRLTYVESMQHRNIVFVFLKGSYDLILKRLQARTGHFMPSSLLRSQLDTLEEPLRSENHLTIDIDRSVQNIVQDITQRTSTTNI